MVGGEQYIREFGKAVCATKHTSKQKEAASHEEQTLHFMVFVLF